ncbi:hypothetical protein [Streptomyces radiopugnans]|uniref:Uncharacterized protein n=1 Tax=Streptomyces radiopugnans TaxID=403935 RepID=A0A1H9KG04_9ACTN|nr:hypothetical protein [Streptomyces radiopugnans]SEQ97773.1 hypothetical protein SAMN05216481_12323 [Streptomyces radiopugnans]
MTDQAPQPPMPDFPPQPESQPEQPPAAAPAEAKRLSNKVVIGAAAAVIATIIGTGVVVVQAIGNDGSEPTATASASSAPTEDVATAAADEPTPEPPVYADLTPDSFTITLRTTAQQCFGSAGCHVTVEPDLSYVGLSDDIDPDATYEITYEIKGDESGPVIGTAELSERTTLNYTPSSLSTVSSDTKLSVEITDVRTTGL